MATDRLHLMLYRAILLTTAAVALVLGIVAGLEAPGITPEYQLTGYWRAYGLLVFAALSAYLGATPPGAAVLWLVVIFHKASMTMTAVLLLRHEVTGAPAAAAVDGAMVLATLVALGLRRPAARASRDAKEQSRAMQENARAAKEQSRAVQENARAATARAMPERARDAPERRRAAGGGGWALASSSTP